MSAVIVVPQLIAQAATDLTSLASTLDAAHLTAAAPTQAVMPAAADEVSSAVAQLFSRYAREYDGLAGQAARYQQQFVEHLSSAATGYASAEVSNAAVLQPFAAAAVAAATAAALPSFDQILDALLPYLWQTLAYAYYLFFLLLIPIYGALALYLPLALLGGLLGL